MLDKLLDTILPKALAEMTAHQVVVATALIAAMFFAAAVFNAVLDYRLACKEIEARVQLQQLENERLALFERALRSRGN